MTLALITLIIPRISSGAHKVCSMEGVCMPSNLNKTELN